MLTRYGLTLSEIENMPIARLEAFLEAANWLFAKESVRQAECIGVALGGGDSAKATVKGWFERLFKSTEARSQENKQKRKGLTFAEMVAIASGGRVKS
jgi:hypothetical protein